MGYNTSVIVLNDALGSIGNDAEFGKKLVSAIAKLSLRQGAVDISSGCDVNAATVVETHHADITTLIAFGGNCATVLHESYGYRHDDTDSQVKLLKEVATKLGYKLIKLAQK